MGGAGGYPWQQWKSLCKKFNWNKVREKTFDKTQIFLHIFPVMIMEHTAKANVIKVEKTNPKPAKWTVLLVLHP